MSSASIYVPPELKKCVAFIFIEQPTQQLIPNGTGFFIIVKGPSGGGWGYLVTAKHVLMSERSHSLYPTVWVRINKRAGGVENLRLDLIPDGGGKNVFVHTDPSVDVAVVPIRYPDPNIYDTVALTDDLLAAKGDFQKLDIHEGSDIFFVGMFLPHLGVARNYPIVRFGKVALLSDEPVSWDGALTDLYLMETMSFGGNSGSPVFFYLGADNRPGVLTLGPATLRLAGIMEGYFGEYEPMEAVQTNVTPATRVNYGVAAVIPAYKIHEILYGPELEGLRSRTATKK
jgi:hypothetical protein